MIKVELLHVAGCANLEVTRALLQACLVEASVEAEVEDRVGAFPSPSVLVNGTDVMGPPEAGGAMCRLDIPTRECLLAALTS